MIAVAAVLGVLGSAKTISALTATDFFPLIAGTRYTYEQRGTLNATTTDEVMPSFEVKGQTISPVFSYEGGRSISRTFYRTAEDAIYIYAYVKDKPITPPMPVFRFTGKETTWDYNETPKAGSDPLNQMKIHGVAKLGPVREILGKKVETLEIKLEAELSGDGTLEKISQTTIYGRGLGLVSSLTRNSLRKQTVTSDVRLIRVDPPQEKQ